MTDFDIAIRAYEAQCDDAEEEPKTYCDCCGKPIYEGDTIFKIGGDTFGECCCERTWA